ncbi:hypothetical protein [Actinomadura xylanilytica]|uniref:hypothetical protein n=1 Tax=Actinomadura xylanilytica TaxID=887459 RepID=UPI00255ACB88|nr:hypothetical protein [Actinomadura xylanilytica]MDL4777312.1 hypothetical protein [Actinomadura xylanilytica]
MAGTCQFATGIVLFAGVDRPRIRLVLADTGSDSGRWRQVGDTLLDMRGGPDHLVPVLKLDPGRPPRVLDPRPAKD